MQSFKKILSNKKTKEVFDPQIFGLKPDEEQYSYKHNAVFCKKCGGVRGKQFEEYFVRCLCNCQQSERDKKAKAEALQKRYRELADLKSMSLLGKRFEKVRFDNTEIVSENFGKVINRLKKYCETAEDRLRAGDGFYIYSEESGTGKSRLTACVGNELMLKGYSVMFTNFIEIAQKIKDSYSGKALMSELGIVNEVANFDFVIFDDFGTEKFKKASDDTFYQEKVYDIINKRYNGMRPTIFSSNLTPQQLVEERGVYRKTVDRVVEMSRVIFKLTEQNYRLKNRKTEKAEF